MNPVLLWVVVGFNGQLRGLVSEPMDGCPKKLIIVAQSGYAKISMYAAYKKLTVLFVQTDVLVS